MAHLSLSLLGTCEGTLDGCSLTGFRTQKVRALLAYLAVHADRAHGREALAFLLWPEQPDETARTYLRQALANLRAVLDEKPMSVPLLLITRDTVQLNPACALDLDIATFRTLIAACARHPHHRAAACTACARRLEHAVELYGGSFLGSFYLRESTAFEEWAALTREALHQEAVTVLAQLALYHERRGTYDVVERLARRQLALDPWREEAHQQLMRALALSGQRSAALEQFDRCRAILQTELGVEPSAETEALYRQIRAEQFVPERVRARAVGLPSPTSSFVGREEDQAALVEHLTVRTCRLVTLLGPPGIGKTRLSLEVAAALVDDFEDGVVFVPLATLRDSDLVVPTIAATLQVAETAREPVLETLTRALQTRHLLLVLDNFEQVVSAGPLVVELLQAAPALTVLVTSRVVLNLSGEHVYPVSPLALPDLRRLPSLEALRTCAAVTLFSARAQAAMRDFVLTSENARWVAEICTRLDGLPLAIELAAARIRMLSPALLMDRLQRRMDLLTGGPADLPTRHQTLRGAIAWSYDLLTPSEQRLFTRLGVFAGGFTLAAAVAICQTPDQPLHVLDELHVLIAKSLVQPVAPPHASEERELRFAMLETIREYAREQLLARGEADELHRRHAAFFLDIAEAAERSQEMSWLERLELEHDNLRAGLRWALSSSGSGELAQRLTGALWWFWLGAGHTTEGRRWSDAALELPDTAPVPVRANALVGAGRLALAQHEPDRARMLLETSLSLFEMAGRYEDVAWTLLNLGLAASAQGAAQLARHWVDESLTWFRKLGNPRGIAWALVERAHMALEQGDCVGALEMLDQAVAAVRASDDPHVIAWLLHHRGKVELARANMRTAHGCFADSLKWFRDHRGGRGIVANLEGIAQVWSADILATPGATETNSLRQLGHRVAWLSAKVAMLHELSGLPVAPAEQGLLDSMIAGLRDRLGEAAWSAAWAEGRDMELEQVIACALIA